MASTDLLEELRPPAFAIALPDAREREQGEDVVQEGLLRLHRTLESGERVESPRAYVGTVVTRLAIDQLRSARARRETYMGEWLPEPLVEAGEGDPAWEADLADSLSFAFLVVLESLSPEQRAAFLLREVFDYPYDRIAEIVGKSEDNVRQLTARARRHVEERRPALRVLCRAARRAGGALLRRRPRGRTRRARGAARRGRRPARRRRRQGTGARAAAPGGRASRRRSPPGGAAAPARVASSSGRSRSMANPARSRSRPGSRRSSACLCSTSRGAHPCGSARSSIRTSCATSGRR